MWCWLKAPGVAVGLAIILLAGEVSGQSRAVVTLVDLIRSNHVIEVEAGTELVWADPHFERVWFSPGANAPRVERFADGFRAVFERPGTYRGLFAVAGWRHGEIDRLTVIVRGAQ